MDGDYGIVARGVCRSFGRVDALRGIDLTAPYGQVTALVGPNGAGKTTLMLILATLLAPDRGEVRVGGIDPVTDPVGVRRQTGWMPEGLFVGATHDRDDPSYRRPFVNLRERLVPPDGVDYDSVRDLDTYGRGPHPSASTSRTP